MRRRTSRRSRCSRTFRSCSSANPALPVRSVAELLAQARAEPGKLSVGHGGNGTAMHLSVQLLKLMAGVDMTEVAYRGSGPVALDVIGGQVPLGMLDLPSVLQQIKAGKVRALAVTGSARLAAAARRADARRGRRQGLRVDRLVRRRRAGGDAAGRRRAPAERAARRAHRPEVDRRQAHAVGVELTPDDARPSSAASSPARR